MVKPIFEVTMGLFDFFKKSSESDVELYYRERNKLNKEQSINNMQYNNGANNMLQSGFSLVVEDVFSIRGKGTVITGRIKSGSVRTGDTVTLQRVNSTTRSVVVVGIEKFSKRLDFAQAGENVGMFLKDVSKNDISRGDILIK